jgi:ADP-ribose pyrophosphatase YjhB (NUDIX family)
MSAGVANFVRRVPEGEDRERLICGDCGFVAYENPKIVTGSVVAVDGKILLCRRAIEPRRGFWTIPAGYMELGETVEEAARREAQEEACADIALDGVLALYSIARIGQVQVLFRASLATPGFAPGPESLEVKLFAWAEIPWDELAFPSVHWVLQAWAEAGPGPLGVPRTNPPEDRRGTHRLAEGA